MQSLTSADRRCLEAAEGWLGLDNWPEAKAELDQVTPQAREHPAVLCMRWNIHAAAKQWESAEAIARKLSRSWPELPFSWIQLAHSLHALKRTEEARNVLLPVVDRFPGEALMRYKLACYTCQLGDFKAAQRWLKAALDCRDGGQVAQLALQDPELKPLWAENSA